MISMKFQPLFITMILVVASCSAFRPQDKETLQNAVDECVECIKKSVFGDCPDGPHAPIGDWDVSAVTDMGQIFNRASVFNQDLSKWDMSAVTNMAYMFSRATAFNQDLSKWDVSAVTDMRDMFSGPSVFN